MTLNLSRQPFTNHRLFWISIAAIFLITLWLGLWITAERTRVSAMADNVQIRIKEQEYEVQRGRQLETERRSREQQKVVISEQDTIQLAAARQLIERKTFSWNRIIGDIEIYVPKDARIMSIKVGDVSAAPDGVIASVEVKALGKTPAELTEMMTRLDASGGLFERKQASQEQATDTGEVPFTIILAYRPSRGGAQ